MSKILYSAASTAKGNARECSIRSLCDVIFDSIHISRAQCVLKSLQSYIYNDPDNYSLSDLVQVKNGKLYRLLSDALKSCENHVNQCEVNIDNFLNYKN